MKPDQGDDLATQPNEQAESAEADVAVQPVEPPLGDPVQQVSAVDLGGFPGDRPFCEDLSGPTHDQMWGPLLPPLEERLRALSFTSTGRPVLRAHWWLAA